MSTGKKRFLGVEDLWVDAAAHTGQPDQRGNATLTITGLASKFLRLDLDGQEVTSDIEFSGAITFSGSVTLSDISLTTLSVSGTATLSTINSDGLVTLSKTGTALSVPNGTAALNTLTASTVTIAGATFGSGVLKTTTFSASGLIEGSGGLTISAGATNVQALTSATGITVTTGGLSVSAGGITVSSGTTTLKDLVAVGVTISGNVTMSGTGTTAALKAVTATSLSVAGNIAQTSGTTTLLATSVSSLSAQSITVSGKLTLEADTIQAVNDESSPSTTLDLTGRKIIKVNDTSGVTVTSLTAALDGKEVTIYNYGTNTYTLGAGVMEAGVAHTIAAGKGSTFFCSGGKLCPASTT